MADDEPTYIVLPISGDAVRADLITSVRYLKPEKYQSGDKKISILPKVMVYAQDSSAPIIIECDSVEVALDARKLIIDQMMPERIPYVAAKEDASNG